MIFKTVEQLILASASPRRHAMLSTLGLVFDSIPAQVSEDQHQTELPSQYVQRIAEVKARAVSDQYPSAWVLGADTVVVVDDAVLGKPMNAKHAASMLRRLSGSWHKVWTGYCLTCYEKSMCMKNVAKTDVRFVAMSDAVIDAYVATGEFRDKAGGYGIQGQGGCLIEAINGSYTNVVGLPLAQIVTALLQAGVIVPAADC